MFRVMPLIVALEFPLPVYAWPGTVLDVHDGDTMTVALDANATTGYEWASSIEGEAVKAVGDEYKAETSSDGKAGAGGVHTFTYQAEGSGEATITLKYARSWEASDADKTVVVKTEVKDGAFAEASVQ